ncbi:MAG: hypothetical protein NZ951_04110 [Dehalococcoidia bacterium]|nr:hypothetical protein [Dehalococcoidia bacterium]MDW8120507.1 hypothetical protein [Chloroflexota bacterium]
MWRSGRLFLWVVPLLLLLGACRSAPPPGNPALPPGFADAPLPDAPVAAYVYFAQQEPLRLHPGAFAAEAQDEEAVRLSSLAAWLAPDAQTFGASGLFPNPQDATAVEDILREVQPPIWTLRSGQRVYLVRGEGSAADALRQAIQNGRQVRLQDAYPKAWDALRRLPEKPPGTPVAAGFALTTREFLEALSRRTGGDVGGLQQALGTARIEVVAFALYVSQPLALDRPLQGGPLAFLDQHKAVALAVGRASVPAVVIRAALGVVARQAGLQPHTVEGQTVYALQQDGIHMRLRAQGNIFYLAAAPRPEDADRAIASTFPPK